MARLIERIGPIRHRPKRLPPFQSLVHAVIHQQLSGKAARTILGRFCAIFGTSGFPTPNQVLGTTHDTLREAGLSRSKAAYILEIAQKAEDRLIPSLEECDSLTDREIVERLTTIKGVGRWTVEMFLIFNIGRPDVFPIHDLGVRRGFQIAHGKRKMPEPEQLARHGKRWAPFRSLSLAGGGRSRRGSVVKRRANQSLHSRPRSELVKTHFQSRGHVFGFSKHVGKSVVFRFLK
jgi:3-methyladenine DNA glycosylase/8-oxoguanine DNA glycosylase